MELWVLPAQACFSDVDLAAPAMAGPSATYCMAYNNRAVSNTWAHMATDGSQRELSSWYLDHLKFVSTSRRE